jgi:hypothetical protein
MDGWPNRAMRAPAHRPRSSCISTCHAARRVDEPSADPHCAQDARQACVQTRPMCTNLHLQHPTTRALPTPNQSHIHMYQLLGCKPHQQLGCKPHQQLRCKPHQQLGCKPHQQLECKPDQQLGCKPHQQLGCKLHQQLRCKPHQQSGCKPHKQSMRRIYHTYTACALCSREMSRRRLTMRTLLGLNGARAAAAGVQTCFPAHYAIH